MKKLLTTTIIAAMIASLGAAFAQAVHEVDIRIPSLLMIRITTGAGSNTVASNPEVLFDFVTLPANVEAYTTAIAAGSGTLNPTSVTNFGDVRVLANRATWRVTVSAGTFTFTPTVTGDTADGIALSDIRVMPANAGVTTWVTARLADWNVTTTANIASGIRTQGWRSLGFSGSDYQLAVQGDEAAGTWTTNVTYTITAP